MSNNTLITIITVVYNAEKTIEQTILSVINQTYNNIEYIIIDGGSTDNTIDIIKKYESRITYWISEPDNGIYDAMNKGIRFATGEWINFMNSGDTFFDKEVITSFVNSTKNLNCYSVIYGKTLCKFKWGNYIITPSILEDIINKMPFCHQSAFVKLDLLKNTPFNVNYKICADHHWFLNLYNSNKQQFYYIPITISIFDAINGISTTNNLSLHKEIGKIKNSKLGSFKWILKKFILYSFPLSISNQIYKILYYFNKRFQKINI